MEGYYSPEQIVQMDKEAIYLGNLFTVDTDLKLPVEGKRGSKISWKSDNSYLITNEGKITRPEFGKGNRKAVLMAAITYGEAYDTKAFEVTILEKEPDYKITAVREVYLKCIIGHAPELPSIVIIEKDDGTYGVSEVKWEIVNQELYMMERVIKVSGTVDGTNLKALANVEITRNHSSDEKVDDKFIHPFEISCIELMDDIFTANKNRGEEFLLNVDDDRMLYNFRDAASLDTRGAEPMVGWDAPECKLKGHTTGHYLSAISYAYRGSGNERFRQKIDYMISELKKCQDAMEKSGKFNYGFLSAYSEEQFDKLEEYTVYPKIWAPYYTLHKIIAGLLDCYELGENNHAIEVCKKLGTWVFNRLNRLTKEQLTKMWSMYIAGEFGGMNEVMARLYGITGNKDYLKAAKFFDNEKLFMPMENNVDTLGGMHANQHVPQIVGALELYSQTKEKKYYQIAKNFWDMAVSSHIYNIGGVGEVEMFKPEGKIGSFISQKTAETCATYNMLKLTKELFCYSPDAKYMDYYERALYNHILASQDQSGPVGASTYFMPLCPNGKKHYDEDGNSCCHGTGMENHVKYQEAVYYHNNDELYINLYIPSKLYWKDRNITVIQSGDYLRKNTICIEIKGSAEFNVQLRVPFWAEKRLTVKVNGEEEVLNAHPGSYTGIFRKWQDGDKIEISIPFTFRLERTPDIANIAGIMYGPLVMVAKSDINEYIELDLNENNIAKRINKTEEPLMFELSGMLLIPNYEAWDCHYHAYFKIK